MAQNVEAGAGQPSALIPSRAASIGTLLSTGVAIVGVVGQLAVHGSVGFAMLAGFGLAVLAAIVFAHQQ